MLEKVSEEQNNIQDKAKMPDERIEVDTTESIDEVSDEEVSDSDSPTDDVAEEQASTDIESESDSSPADLSEDKDMPSNDDTTETPIGDDTQPDHEQAESRITTESDSAPERKRMLDVLLKALEIDGRWFRRNLGLFFVITVGMLLFVTNRYQADQEIIEEGLLKDTLADIKYKALTKAADLTLKTRQSNIETLLRLQGDSAIKTPKDAPYIIKKPSSQDTGYGVKTEEAAE